MTTENSGEGFSLRRHIEERKQAGEPDKTSSPSYDQTNLDLPMIPQFPSSHELRILLDTLPAGQVKDLLEGFTNIRGSSKEGVWRGFALGSRIGPTEDELLKLTPMQKRERSDSLVGVLKGNIAGQYEPKRTSDIIAGFQSLSVGVSRETFGGAIRSVNTWRSNPQQGSN